MKRDRGSFSDLADYYMRVGVKQISIIYTSIDGVNKVRHCETIAGARAWAMYWVGECPELGLYYAVSADGVGKVTVSGLTIHDLFPEHAEYVFTVHTLDSHEHFGPFGSYSAAFNFIYDKDRHATYQIEVQRVDKWEGSEINRGVYDRG